MDREPVRSSNIQSVGYDASTSTLEVEFHGGSIYQYFSVPEPTYQALMAATSKGAYLNKHIKNRYRFKQLK